MAMAPVVLGGGGGGGDSSLATVTGFVDWLDLVVAVGVADISLNPCLDGRGCSIDGRGCSTDGSGCSDLLTFSTSLSDSLTTSAPHTQWSTTVITTNCPYLVSQVLQ